MLLSGLRGTLWWAAGTSVKVEEVNWVGEGSRVEVEKLVVFGWKWVKVFAVELGMHRGVRAKLVGGLGRWWFGELGGEMWEVVVVWMLGILKVEGGLGVLAW